MQEPLGTALKCRHQGSSQPSSTAQLNQDPRPAAGEQMESRHVKLQTLGLLKTTRHEGVWHSCRNTELWSHLPQGLAHQLQPTADFQPYQTNHFTDHNKSQAQCFFYSYVYVILSVLGLCERPCFPSPESPVCCPVVIGCKRFLTNGLGASRLAVGRGSGLRG